LNAIRKKIPTGQTCNWVLIAGTNLYNPRR
jgi:hypothetical protein